MLFIIVSRKVSHGRCWPHLNVAGQSRCISWCRNANRVSRMYILCSAFYGTNFWVNGKEPREVGSPDLFLSKAKYCSLLWFSVGSPDLFQSKVHAPSSWFIEFNFLTNDYLFKLMVFIVNTEYFFLTWNYSVNALNNSINHTRHILFWYDHYLYQAISLFSLSVINQGWWQIIYSSRLITIFAPP